MYVLLYYAQFWLRTLTGPASDVVQTSTHSGNVRSSCGVTGGKLAGVEVAATRRARVTEVLRTTYRVIRSNPTGRLALRGSIALVGGLVVAVGIVLIPLPGPGWAIVLLGLSIWAIEFVWARHLLQFTRQQLRRWWRWLGIQSWPVRIAVGTAGLLFVAVVVWASLKYSLGIDVLARVAGYLATH